MEKIHIIGAGPSGREVCWTIDRINAIKPTWEIAGFIDDDKKLVGKYVDDYPVLGTIDTLIESIEKINCVCCIGTGSVRQKVIEKLQYDHITFPTIVDPSVILGRGAQIGAGCIITAGTIVSIHSRVGNHVMVHFNCTLGHDSVINDFCTINPGSNISGWVQLEKCVDVGTGVQIIQKKTVAENTIIGAGALVVKDIMESGTYVGVPAKKIN